MIEVSQEKKTRILEGTLSICNRDGLKFTMDDLAKELGMSKKTIYAIFADKEELLLAMADYCFDSIHSEKDKILKRLDIGLDVKIRLMLGAMPETYLRLDLQQLFILREKFPSVYAHVEKRLDSDWEPTIALLEKGMEEGICRKFSIPVFRTMMQSTLAQFFQKDILIRNKLTYQDGLREVIDILVSGILKTSE